MQVVMDYNTGVDYLVLLIDTITMMVVVYYVFIFQRAQGALLIRASLGVVAVAMGYQVFAILSRHLGDPLQGGSQTGWALKDICIFMYVVSNFYSSWRARQISRHQQVPGSVEEAVVRSDPGYRVLSEDE